MIQYLPLLNILDMFDNEIFTCSAEKKNELTFQLSIMAFICFKMTLDVSEQLQNTPQLIYMSLNKNSVYCVMPRSSKPPDTCK